MPNKEYGSSIKEEPFLRTARGKLAVASLSASMILASLAIADALKPVPPKTDYDPNQSPITIRMSDEEMKKFDIKPKLIEDIPSLRDIKHVLPEKIEELLDTEVSR